MKNIPFSLLPLRTLKRLSRLLRGTGEILQAFFPSLRINLLRAEFKISSVDYISMCLVATFVFYLFSSIFLSLILKLINVEKPYLGFLFAIFFTIFVFIIQISYPGVVAHRKINDIEKNLLPALQNMLVQLNSGVPLFEILVNISKSDYGELSYQFSKIVKEINAGKHESDALDEVAATNPSEYFRKAIWQIVNGMKSGADMSNVLTETINSLSEEQLLQIQRYGSQLNPLAMFYMLVAIIAPSLGMTFLIILSSLISLSAFGVKMIFYSLYLFVVILQILFLGIIKSRRPNLLGEK